MRPDANDTGRPAGGGASLAARGARFFLVAAILWKFGPPMRGFIEKNLALLSTLFFLLLLGGFLVIKYLA